VVVKRRKLSEFLRVGEAADFLGVSPSTLRYWDRRGVVKPSRHPVNGYRLYLRRDLERLLSKAGGDGKARRPGRRRGR